MWTNKYNEYVDVCSHYDNVNEDIVIWLMMVEQKVFNSIFTSKSHFCVIIAIRYSIVNL